MANPVRILAEDHFGGALALVCAAICTALPALYLGAVLVVRIVRCRADPLRDRTDSNLALGIGVVCAIAFGFGLVPYWARALLGETMTGEVAGVEVRRRSDTDVSVYTIRLADGRTLEERVENEDEGLMQPGRQVLVRGVRGVSGFERLGGEATLSQGTLFGSLSAWAVLIALTVALGRRKPRPS